MECNLCVVTFVVLTSCVVADLVDDYPEEIVNRTNSGLTEVPTDIPDGAGVVYLNENQITKIKAGAFSNLKDCFILEILRNHINSIKDGAFNGLGTLMSLDLFDNRLEEVRGGMWTGLDTLEVLHLGKNEIRTLSAGAFQNLPKLDTLFLGDNKMSEIQGGAFDGLLALESILMHDNQIASLHPGAFCNLPKLELVTIYYNKLTTLPEDAFISESGEHPADLNLVAINNPWECDQKMCWVKRAESDGWLYFLEKDPHCLNYPVTPWDEVDLKCSEE